MKNILRALLVLLITCRVAQAQQYKATVIPLNSPIPDIQALNDAGLVVGQGWAFIDGQLVQASSQGFAFLNSPVIVVNNKFDFVTTSSYGPGSGGYTSIQLYQPSFGTQSNLYFSAMTNDAALAINDNGVIVGNTYGAASAWVEGVNGPPFNLSQLAGIGGMGSFLLSYASSVNNLNEILAVQNTPLGQTLHKLMPDLQTGTMHAKQVAVLASNMEFVNNLSSRPKINDIGDILFERQQINLPGPGYYAPAPFLIPHGSDTPIQLNLNQLERAYDINNSGTIVGIALPSANSFGGSAAKMDMINGQPVVTALAPVTVGIPQGCYLNRALKINNVGQIVVVADCNSGYPYPMTTQQVLLLTPSH